MFIFDCCSGRRSKDKERRTSKRKRGDTQTKSIGSVSDLFADGLNESSKNIEVEHILRDETLVWGNGEDNPDFRLITINAANEGFQSKMRIDTGSYMISQFTQRLKENIFNDNNKLFLNEVLDDIQEDLHNNGKQLMTKTFHNKTEYIKFEMNKRGLKKKSKLSMSLIL